MIRISVAARNAGVDAITALLDGGGTLEIRTGSQPATPADADSGTLLAEIELAATAYDPAVSGEAQLAGTPLSADAVASGTAGHFRLKDAQENPVVDGSVSESGGGGDLILDNTDINEGQKINITEMPVSLPMSAE